MNVNRPISPSLTLKLVAMDTSLERSEKRGSYQKFKIKCLPHGENFVKIGPNRPVDREIISLK